MKASEFLGNFSTAPSPSLKGSIQWTVTLEPGSAWPLPPKPPSGWEDGLGPILQRIKEAVFGSSCVAPIRTESKFQAPTPNTQRRSKFQAPPILPLLVRLKV